MDINVKKTEYNGTTVAALSTPCGRGAIAMIRMTGEDSINIASKIFVPKRRMPLSAVDSAHAVYGMFMSDGAIIDDGVVTLYRSPSSYTGENMVEFCCHGGVLVTGIILRSLFEAGAAPASPGEFTKRAFCNGKLRLSQAEAIMDIIDAESVAGLRLAGQAGRGTLSAEAGEMYGILRHLIASTYAYIDYPDEDMTDVSPEDMKNTVQELIKRGEILQNSYKEARAVCEGIKTVICGKPNVGKSSLLNMLTGEDTAIVTEIPGTTRDVITQNVMCGEVLLRLSDTAGIHNTDDTVEKIGIKRARERIDAASLILAVFDGAASPDNEDKQLAEYLKNVRGEVIAIVNKTDVGGFENEYEKLFGNCVRISALCGDGKTELTELIEKLFTGGRIDYTSPHIINARQYSQTLRFIAALRSALDVLDGGMTQDIACLDLEEALAALGELDGLEVTDDIISEIFSKFCVGK